VLKGKTTTRRLQKTPLKRNCGGKMKTFDKTEEGGANDTFEDARGITTLNNV